jgi:predicted HAD superfamily Cof-like phosphohydrolase
MNVFNDQRVFMEACNQSTGMFNRDQFNLYVDLIDKERQGLNEAIDYNDKVEMLDALLDIVVVTVGAMHSLGVDPEGGWDEVIRSNMSKIDPATGEILKPQVFIYSDLSKYVI